MLNRFVILHHTRYERPKGDSRNSNDEQGTPGSTSACHAMTGPEHWDLMLEDGAVLKTWQLETSPLELKPGESIPACALPDHRLAYLEYEGPVSQNRGEVRRIEAGEYSCLNFNKGEARFELSGETSIEPFLFSQAPEGWRLSRQA